MADGPTSGTARTEADLLTNFFQDGQANNSITAQDMRDLVASRFGKLEYPTAAAQLQSFVNQTASGVNDMNIVDLNTQHYIANITHSTTVDPSEITVVEDGVYDIVVSAMFWKTGGGTAITTMALQESLASGGGWVTTSAAVRRDVSGNGVAGFAALGHVDRHVVGDKYRVVWWTDEITASLQWFEGGVTSPTNHADVPSVDFRIKKIGLL